MIASRINVGEYERLASAGILDDPRVELIDGILERKMTKLPRHPVVTEHLRRRLESLLPTDEKGAALWHIQQEDPVRIPDFDEPEPDLALVRGDIDAYRTHHPGPRDVELVVEVAESSLERDRTRKLAIYARAGIPSYWIVNLISDQVEVYTEPSGPSEPVGYSRCEVVSSTGEVALQVEGAVLGTIETARFLL
ncbi:MAG: Uma2 family endonuclease [Planctomycetaceae bacterium]|nr:Uma2 family endonuclease [Planctomycetaceae bacterium]